MYGFFLVDKPSGMTSFDVIRQLKKKFQTKKIGHTGTLDPLATGCLLVAVGEYTKLISFFEKDRKTYTAHITLGGISSSYDSGGEILSLDDVQSQRYRENLSFSQIQSLLEIHFLGNIMQVPPKVSALKIGGKKALERFRDGEVFEMQARSATVFQLSLLSYQYPYLEIEVEVSTGTYIRSIAHDLGQILGCGAYISALRRSSIGNLDISSACSLENISPQSCLSLNEIFPQEQCLFFEDEAVLRRLEYGQRVYIDFPFPQEIPVFLVSDRGVEYVAEYREKILSSLKRIFT